MTRIILCEGETDLILISYYLEKIKGWKYTGTPKGLSFNFTEQENMSACNYKNSKKGELLICAVGGKDNFGNFFNEYLKKPIMRTNAGETEYRIALVTDRDDFSIDEIEKSMSNEFNPIIKNIENNSWQRNEINADLGTKVNIDFLLVVIPKESHGALETVLMEALSKDDYDANIVKKASNL